MVEIETCTHFQVSYVDRCAYPASLLCQLPRLYVDPSCESSVDPLQLMSHHCRPGVPWFVIKKAGMRSSWIAFLVSCLMYGALQTRSSAVTASHKVYGVLYSCLSPCVCECMCACARVSPCDLQSVIGVACPDSLGRPCCPS